MAKHNFQARQAERDQNHFDAGCDFGTQTTWDAVQLALRDPYVVGRKKWGSKKLARLYERTAYYKKYFHEAFTTSPEADVKQEEQDAMLREIWGDDLVPHKDRYPYQKQFSYKKSRKEWR